MHSYARKALENQLEVLDGLINSENPTPICEGSVEGRLPGKKSKTLASEGDTQQNVSNSALMNVMERIEKLQEESLRRLQSLESTVQDNTQAIRSATDSLEQLGKQVDDVTLHVDSLQSQVETLEKENAVLRESASLPKKMEPQNIAQQLHFSVDIVHRLGPRSADRHSSRRIIVQFLSRTHRDKIWKDARTSKLLKERKIQIFEDLTPETKDARNKLWPMVEQARKEGKRAGFRGACALIDVFSRASGLQLNLNKCELLPIKDCSSTSICNIPVKDSVTYLGIIINKNADSSAAQSQTTLEAKLGALQCHFTWDLDPSRSKLFCLRDMLKDIGTEEGNSWQGHIYNLQGYIHYQLGFTEDAQCFFSRAAEALHHMRNTGSDEGPWLVVNYGNLAWLHHQLGEQAESQTYLSKVDTLLKEYPSPSEDELHPEIYAEKAWTLMKFGRDKTLLAADYFERAIRMQPDIVEWQTSHVMALVKGCGHPDEPLEENILEKIKIAKEHDPDNLYLAALYLQERAKKGRKIEDEVRELAEKVLRKPPSSYSGIRPLLKLYRTYISKDEAIDLAEEALERQINPDKRHLKWCAAICYKRRIYSDKDNPLEPKKIDRAISLHKEVISLYPDSSVKVKIALANIYAKLNHGQDDADQIYQDLLETDLEPADRQILYNCYAKYLYFDRKESYKAIKYHMMAAEIPNQSGYRESSIRELKKIKGRRHYMCGEIDEFLAKLQD
ncbi:interferon-induced protein with tetratricopeptide repeats 5-like [Scomber japonicus]|uniref:interferon-induced protein with tetratricopeptide repeats 5-like n=1 Tax=Scomber japonicus TaxID=13676 RepID=UPI002305A831|nr:interferon-induced protein with tetratricopeptide repeats 5-like [Scomber japonicus]